MELITAVLPRVRKLIPLGHGWFTAWVIGSVIGLELYGRATARADYFDIVAAMALIGIASVTFVRHRRTPHPWLGWVTSLAQSLRNRALNLRHEYGVDFRGDPPLARKLPRSIPLSLIGLVSLGALFALAWAANPEGWRSMMAYTPYLLYLTVLIGVWTGLAGVVLIGIVLILRLVEYLFDGASHGSRPALAVGYAATVVFCAFLLPPVIPLILASLTFLVALLASLRPGPEAPGLVWKQRSGELAVIPAHRLLALVVAFGALTIVVLLLAACGGTLLDRPEGIGMMPLTVMGGAVAGWFVPGMVAVIGLMVWTFRRNDPARRTPPTLNVIGPITIDDRRAILAAALRRGWMVQFDQKPNDKSLVPISLVLPEQSQAREFDPGWPLKVSLADLQDGAVFDRLTRRDELQLRRSGFRGLAKLFKRAGLHRGSGGAGVLFAPHWWFIDGLDREDDAPDDSTPEEPELNRLRRVGPPFDRVLAPRVRQHWHAVLRATKIDLIFVEDGVSYRKLERVLRQILEIYDRGGGTKAAEDHLFRGMTKIKVMIHDYQPGRSFDPGVEYPEPKFPELSRARVLHVFRDRGDQDVRDEVPFDFSWEPTPIGIG